MTNNWVQILTELLFLLHIMLGVQVRLLVFDNCQRCPVPLSIQDSLQVKTVFWFYASGLPYKMASPTYTQCVFANYLYSGCNYAVHVVNIDLFVAELWCV